ncbi:MOSC domain-containing protein [Paenibacillus sp. LMG 31456]|uniref:MOSC domain-containing protein n=2 Tax=Paenibacillus foliorum TaxID=2654974 RepID=A0A972GKY5_9BACL|nr:MOSC domain-containing protein [Paenibacillus foliorum]
MIPIGEIKNINRYPVKSLAGEGLETSRIETYGLYGDRSHAFIDETKEGWSSYMTARQIPDLLSYKAMFIGEGSAQEFPKVNVVAPNGRSLNWDEDLLGELQAYSNTKMSMLSYKPNNQDLLAMDTGSILIITDASLRKLEEIWGKRLDKRRFRANLLVAVADNSLSESDWIGKRLIIGSAELEVTMYCERCSMITIDPDTLERDKSLLKKVNEEMNLNFGVYASVNKVGQVSVGDKVFLA